MIERQIKINGMSCEHCVRAVIKELSELDLDYYEVEIGAATLKYDETKIKEIQLNEAISEAGFSIIGE
jgi:copper chaperone